MPTLDTVGYISTEKLLTSPIVLTSLLLVVIWLLLLIPVLSKLLKGCSVDEITPEWMESFSVASYYPMENLLNEEDFAFLSRQPGFDLSLYKKLRRERLQIFKQYLNRAIVDFNRLHKTIRVILPHVKTDCSHLVSELMWIQLRFYLAVIRAELSYWLCLVGFRSLAVRALILQLEDMNSHLSLISAAQGA